MHIRTLSFNIIMNGIKQVCAILFPLVTFSYSAHILGTGNIGIYSYGASIVSYFLLISKLGIPNYAAREGAVIRDNKKHLKDFIDEVYSINSITTAIAMIALIILIYFCPGFSAYKVIILIQSLDLILTLLGADWINTVCEDYIYLTVRYIVIQLIGLVALLIFVRSESDLIVYTFISTFAITGGNILNIRHLKKSGLYPSFRINMNIKTHLGPILVLFANSVASIIYLNSDITLLGIYLGDEKVGVYSAATKIYIAAKTLVNAMIIAAIPRFSNYLGNNKRKEYEESLNKLLKIILMISLPLAVGVFLEADKLIILLAGDSYISGTSVVRILSPAILFAVLACFFAYTVMMPNHLEKQFTVATVVGATVNIVLNFWFIPNLGIQGAAYTTLISEIIVCVFCMIYSARPINTRMHIKSIVKMIIASGLFIPLYLATETIKCNNMILLGIQVIVCITVYYIALRIMGINPRKEFHIE